MNCLFHFFCGRLYNVWVVVPVAKVSLLKYTDNDNVQFNTLYTLNYKESDFPQTNGRPVVKRARNVKKFINPKKIRSKYRLIVWKALIKRYHHCICSYYQEESLLAEKFFWDGHDTLCISWRRHIILPTWKNNEILFSVFKYMASWNE